jgi:hypothetical protein
VTENLNGKYHSVEIGVDGRIILKFICESVYCIELTLYRVLWLKLVSTVMNLRVPQKAEKFLDYLNDYQLLNKDSVPWS